MLTLFQSPTASYDGYGCLKDINKISASHNQLLGEKMIALRTKYPTTNLYYGDIHGVYTDILKNPGAYSMAFDTLYTIILFLTMSCCLSKTNKRKANAYVRHHN